MNSVLSFALYGICSLLLAGASILLLLRDGKSPVARWFVATCLSLLVWVVTLFLFARSGDPSYILRLGRVNFASVSLAVCFGWRFVRAVAGRPRRAHEGWAFWLSLALAAIATFSPYIDRAELPGASGH